jgi:queuine tRNA-ribosyltransferase catalytic subunit
MEETSAESNNNDKDGRKLEYLQQPKELDLFDLQQGHISWEKYHPYPPPLPQPRLQAALEKLSSSPETLAMVTRCLSSSPMPPLVPLDTPPIFSKASPALCFQLHAMEGRARAATLHLAPMDRQGCAVERPPIPTPRFMPVGTKGTLKGVLPEEITAACKCPIILSNTYHLAIQPGTDIIHEMGGLHRFMGAKHDLKQESQSEQEESNENANATTPRSYRVDYSLLTDSGGFQMVSLAKLSKVTEEGVEFENPYSATTTALPKAMSTSAKLSIDEKKSDSDNGSLPSAGTKRPQPSGDTLLLRPEDSIRYQQEIGADIIMALDDVVSSVAVDDDRFQEATYRTLRWYDRCCQAHGKPIDGERRSQVLEPNSRSGQRPMQYWEIQNLFPITQGALDTAIGGLRDQCLAGLCYRDMMVKQRQLSEDCESSTAPVAVPIPGFAIGGVSGGEDKDHFWKVVDVSCRALPDNRPRYLMGVGYPLDLVVCTALGVDMFDCVYPTRTARFGVALTRCGQLLKLKSHACSKETTLVMEEGCTCPACIRGVSRARLHSLLKKASSSKCSSTSTLAVQLITQHNVVYMMTLVNSMRQAIMEQRFAAFARHFVRDHFAMANENDKSEPQQPPDTNDAATEDATTAARIDSTTNKSNDCIPKWVRDALDAAGISLDEA